MFFFLVFYYKVMCDAYPVGDRPLEIELADVAARLRPPAAGVPAAPSAAVVAVVAPPAKPWPNNLSCGEKVIAAVGFLAGVTMIIKFLFFELPRYPDMNPQEEPDPTYSAMIATLPLPKDFKTDFAQSSVGVGVAIDGSPRLSLPIGFSLSLFVSPDTPNSKNQGITPGFTFGVVLQGPNGEMDVGGQYQPSLPALEESSEVRLRIWDGAGTSSVVCQCTDVYAWINTIDYSTGVEMWCKVYRFVVPQCTPLQFTQDILNVYEVASQMPLNQDDYENPAITKYLGSVFCELQGVNWRYETPLTQVANYSVGVVMDTYHTLSTDTVCQAAIKTCMPTSNELIFEMATPAEGWTRQYIQFTSSQGLVANMPLQLFVKFPKRKVRYIGFVQPDDNDKVWIDGLVGFIDSRGNIAVPNASVSDQIDADIESVGQDQWVNYLRVYTSSSYPTPDTFDSINQVTVRVSIPDGLFEYSRDRPIDALGFDDGFTIHLDCLGSTTGGGSMLYIPFAYSPRLVPITYIQNLQGYVDWVFPVNSNPERYIPPNG